MKIISIVSAAVTVLLAFIAAGLYFFDIEWRLRSLEPQSFVSATSLSATSNVQQPSSSLPSEIAAACASIIEKLNDELKLAPNPSKVESYQTNLKLLRCDR